MFQREWTTSSKIDKPFVLSIVNVNWEDLCVQVRNRQHMRFLNKRPVSYVTVGPPTFDWYVGSVTDQRANIVKTHVSKGLDYVYKY